jgi:molybdate transport system substrate-binding protein
VSRRPSLIGVLIGALLFAGCAVAGGGPSPAPRTTVTVAAAADLRYALDEVIAAHRELEPDIDVAVSYGSSGSFHAQITNGAPFDVYFSADIEYPRRLEAAGLAPAGSTLTYAIGQIVIWAQSGSGIDVGRGFDALLDPAAERVAIANPEHAPYGRAAVAALRSAGIYEAVEPRLVLGENIAQAAQFVQSGAADVGIIALSLALAPTLRDTGRHWLVPIDSYPTLEQGVVVLDRAVDAAAAAAFRDFVLGGQGRLILDRYGFVAPED